jgi:hypothetical protein
MLPFTGIASAEPELPFEKISAEVLNSIFSASGITNLLQLF